MSVQIDGVWNTNPDMDRLERQREDELDSQDCTGGVSLHPPMASLVQHKLPEAEARADGRSIPTPAGVGRCEGLATPSQPRDDVEGRPARQGHSAGVR